MPDAEALSRMQPPETTADLMHRWNVRIRAGTIWMKYHWFGILGLASLVAIGYWARNDIN